MGASEDLGVVEVSVVLASLFPPPPPAAVVPLGLTSLGIDFSAVAGAGVLSAACALVAAGWGVAGLISALAFAGAGEGPVRVGCGFA